jgi:uncharacterized repeat protein (TIGR03837 family)
MQARWDIFCNVVDNYGDIGVTWRLARQLVAEHRCQVRLWVDDLLAFGRLQPSADVRAAVQVQRGVEVCHWPAQWAGAEPADVVIEAFGCRLPPAYEAALAARRPAPLWLNLEYLSAEAWVADCHGLPSLQSNGVPKFFFFPGFDDDAGGLPREAHLLERRRAFQADAAAAGEWLRERGVSREEGARLVSLFAYENPGVGEWLEALAAGAQPTQLLIPEGKVLASVAAWLGSRPVRGEPVRRGRLRLDVLPFVEQDEYDRLLWCCDFNVVRGEDSFLRAQWAGRPLLWHIYPQQEGAHWVKLEAFLERYVAGSPDDAAQALRGLWRAWNAETGMAQAWAAIEPFREALQHHAEAWCSRQAARPDLASRLVHFYTDSL